jgi:hypothetical protein
MLLSKNQMKRRNWVCGELSFEETGIGLAEEDEQEMGVLQRVGGRRGKTVLNLEELTLYFAVPSSLLWVWRICANLIGLRVWKLVVGDGAGHGPD